MKFNKSVLVITLSGFLAACGGDGYYDKSPSTGTSNGDNSSVPSGEQTSQQILDTIKREGQFLFGNYDPNDEKTAKGYIDHALDTFAQGPLQLALDAKKLFDQDKSAFVYREKCMNSDTYTNTSCYILFNDATIKNQLNKVNPNKYSTWDFDVNDNELTGMKLSDEQIDKFTGKTMIIIFDNRNADKKFNDIWVTGVFGYPYKQSWGLTQSDQLRIVSMNAANSEYEVTLTYDDETTETKGALSIYKDPTSTDGELYVLQNNSSFDVLTNDNPNTPEVETVNFEINSVVGDPAALATYRVKANAQQILDIPNVSAIIGTRVENESPSKNEKNFVASIHLEGENIFTFKESLNGSILKFKHIIDGITYEGTSTNNNGTIQTNLTSPTNLKY
ncbi:hypothetical protein [Acinetobacter pseudolwoffii]|uniref:hypothetical protein n=1 Tax=Acinetobacter pseudolwoffii TaxID=2053287 RepID=UPI0021E4D4C5|nr:hypothetical protein [Acinetobacter pseudolwoffii]